MGQNSSCSPWFSIFPINSPFLTKSFQSSDNLPSKIDNKSILDHFKSELESGQSWRFFWCVIFFRFLQDFSSFCPDFHFVFFWSFRLFYDCQQRWSERKILQRKSIKNTLKDPKSPKCKISDGKVTLCCFSADLCYFVQNAKIPKIFTQPPRRRQSFKRSKNLKVTCI